MSDAIRGRIVRVEADDRFEHDGGSRVLTVSVVVRGSGWELELEKQDPEVVGAVGSDVELIPVRGRAIGLRSVA